MGSAYVLSYYSPITMEQLSPFSYWKRCFTQNYANFSGRARRSEYWGFVLLQMLIAFPLYVWMQLSDGVSLAGVLYGLFALAGLLPNLAVLTRRLHDTGRSGWWVFVIFIPLVGSILLLVWVCSDSQYGTNKYGPSPKYPDSPEF